MPRAIGARRWIAVNTGNCSFLRDYNSEPRRAAAACIVSFIVGTPCALTILGNGRADIPKAALDSMCAGGRVGRREATLRANEAGL